MLGVRGGAIEKLKRNINQNLGSKNYVKILILVSLSSDTSKIIHIGGCKGSLKPFSNNPLWNTLKMTVKFH